MSAAVTFDGAPEQGTINFSVGQPSADLLPLALLRGACEGFFAHAQPFELNYGERQGDLRFRAALAAFLNAAGDSSADPHDLMLTGGISQALDFVCGRLTQPGDTVFVEEPSYPYAFPIFRDHGLNIVGIPLDGRGMDLDRCERALARHRPKLLYTIPSFHNPTGQTLGQERRARLVELGRAHGFVILADEVYQLLHHGTPPPPSFGALAKDGAVLSLGSFSKIVAPGLRLGWIQTDEALMRVLLASGALVSGGNFNHFTSHIVRQLLENGELASNIARLRSSYAARAQAMDEALQTHLGGIATWQKPLGGYFFWLDLPAGVDAAGLQEAARAAGTGFLPGTACSTAGGLGNGLRLSFAHYAVPEIHEGIARLKRAIVR
ncbi:MAG TPA: PLP-dependent aminotransferase family protein [Steroidobacteraceae bacterium]|nr:PLP-dependent aminotransferase family protein [Steroidobacteraceae bacterium]